MPWQLIGNITPNPDTWIESQLNAIDQDLLKVTFNSATGSASDIKSKILFRRKWEDVAGANVIERATVIYPSTSETITLIPIPNDFLEAGLVFYKIEIRKLWGRRYYNPVLEEPIYSIRLEVR